MESSFQMRLVFFTRRNERLYLVTNWHVVSGRNADTEETLDVSAAIPDELRVYLPDVKADGSFQFGDRQPLSVMLYEGERKKWLDLKMKGKWIDVTLIPMDEKEDAAIIPIENCEEPFNDAVRFEITSPVYVIGFPFGKIAGDIPIWKRATVASEPTYDMDDLPYYFVDTATREGMSGSPVIFFKDRPVIIGNGTSDEVSIHWTKFMGIYSGRIGANKNMGDAQLGRVWKVDVIDKIITTSTQGTE